MRANYLPGALIASSIIAIGLTPCPSSAQELNATVRDAAQVREFKRNYACPSTGKKDPYEPCPGFVVDHPIPLCASGPDDSEINMIWQEKEASYKKDVHERRICREIARLREENDRLREALQEATK